MGIKKVDSTALHEWIDRITKSRRVFGIQSKSDRFVFDQLVRADDLRLDYDVSILPPTLFFRPQRETLLSFNKPDSGYQSVIDSEPFVLLGVHPYDMVAIRQTDALFSQGNYDTHYMSRRENATIVVSDVQSVSPDVFAGYMGTSHIEDGYDVLLTQIGDDYLIESRTPKGDSLTAGLDINSETQPKWIEERNAIWESNRQRLRRHRLKAKPETWPALLEDAESHPLWQERSTTCFSCGSCNMVCPTCYCFDVREEINWNLSDGQRVRVWDGCMLTDFAKVAGNLNFRKDRTSRYRHRYYRKGKYVPPKIGGEIACVGCGRCITACVARIANPVEVFNQLAEAK